MVYNGYKTYSKASFKEDKHPRESGGTFKARMHTEEDDVEYHYDFDKSKHARSKDGSFIPKNASNEVKTGYARYGSIAAPKPNGTGSGYGGHSS